MSASTETFHFPYNYTTRLTLRCGLDLTPTGPIQFLSRMRLFAYAWVLNVAGQVYFNYATSRDFCHREVFLGNKSQGRRFFQFVTFSSNRNAASVSANFASCGNCPKCFRFKRDNKDMRRKALLLSFGFYAEKSRSDPVSLGTGYAFVLWKTFRM